MSLHSYPSLIPSPPPSLHLPLSPQVTLHSERRALLSSDTNVNAAVDHCAIELADELRTSVGITSSHLDLRERHVVTSTNYSIVPRISVLLPSLLPPSHPSASSSSLTPQAHAYTHTRRASPLALRLSSSPSL